MFGQGIIFLARIITVDTPNVVRVRTIESVMGFVSHAELSIGLIGLQKELYSDEKISDYIKRQMQILLTDIIVEVMSDVSTDRIQQIMENSGWGKREGIVWGHLKINNIDVALILAKIGLAVVHNHDFGKPKYQRSLQNQAIIAKNLGLGYHSKRIQGNTGVYLKQGGTYGIVISKIEEQDSRSVVEILPFDGEGLISVTGSGFEPFSNVKVTLTDFIPEHVTYVGIIHELFPSVPSNEWTFTTPEISTSFQYVLMTQFESSLISFKAIITHVESSNVFHLKTLEPFLSFESGIEFSAGLFGIMDNKELFERIKLILEGNEIIVTPEDVSKAEKIILTKSRGIIWSKFTINGMDVGHLLSKIGLVASVRSITSRYTESLNQAIISAKSLGLGIFSTQINEIKPNLLFYGIVTNVTNNTISFIPFNYKKNVNIIKTSSLSIIEKLSFIEVFIESCVENLEKENLYRSKYRSKFPTIPINISITSKLIISRQFSTEIITKSNIIEKIGPNSIRFFRNNIFVMNSFEFAFEVINVFNKFVSQVDETIIPSKIVKVYPKINSPPSNAILHNDSYIFKTEKDAIIFAESIPSSYKVNFLLSEDEDLTNLLIFKLIPINDINHVNLQDSFILLSVRRTVLSFSSTILAKSIARKNFIKNSSLISNIDSYNLRNDYINLLKIGESQLPLSILFPAQKLNILPNIDLLLPIHLQLNLFLKSLRIINSNVNIAIRTISTILSPNFPDLFPIINCPDNCSLCIFHKILTLKKITKEYHDLKSEIISKEICFAYHLINIALIELNIDFFDNFN